MNTGYEKLLLFKEMRCKVFFRQINDLIYVDFYTGFENISVSVNTKGVYEFHLKENPRLDE